MKNWFSFLCAAIAAMTLGACMGSDDDTSGGAGGSGGSGGSSDEICEPGESRDCACSDGRDGAQECRSDGSRWDSCECTGGTGGAGGSGGSGGDGGNACLCVPGQMAECACTNGQSGAQECRSDCSGFNSCDCENDTPLCDPGETNACMCTNGQSGSQVCNDDRSGFDPCECTGGGGSGGSGSGDVCISGHTRSCACTNGQTGAQSCNSSGTGYGTCSCTGGTGGTGGGTSCNTTPSCNHGTEDVTVTFTAPSGTQPIQVLVQGQIDGYNNIWGDLCNSQITSVSGLTHPMTRSGSTYTCTVQDVPANQSVTLNVEVRYADATFTPSHSGEQYACWGDWESAGCSSSSPCLRDFGTLQVNGDTLTVGGGDAASNGQGGCNYVAMY